MLNELINKLCLFMFLQIDDPGPLQFTIPLNGLSHLYCRPANVG